MGKKKDIIVSEKQEVTKLLSEHFEAAWLRSSTNQGNS